jgi:hypothetical protein
MTQDFPQAPSAPLPPDISPIIVDTGPPEWAGAVAVMSLLIIFGSIVLWPLVRAWARRLEHGVVSDDLMDELVHLRERVAELEGQGARVAELEERVDFTERLLTEARDTMRLPREGGA